MKKKGMGSAVVLLAAIFATGCGNTIPEMSEQQQELVVEYAAGVLLKYDENHETKLVELTLEQEDIAAEPVSKEDFQDSNVQEEAESAEAADQEEASDVTVIDNTQELENVSIDSFLKLDSVKITYTGYETDDFYPRQEELSFVMNASPGNKLLILKFAAENTSGTDAALDIAQSNTRFKVVVNGEEKNALQTYLLNDMAYYQGTIAPGESVELVLAREIPDEQTEMISSLELILKNVDDIATISLN